MQKKDTNEKKSKQTCFDTLYQLSRELKIEIQKPRPETKVLEKLFNELYSYATSYHESLN